MLNPEPLTPRGEIDIAVIGAGAAGIAAGRRLAAANADFLMFEARSRIGGRSWTSTVAGLPLDLGCGWLHSADRNPWTKIAESAGFVIDRTPAPWTVRRDITFSPEERDGFDRAARELYERVEAAAEVGGDHPASQHLEPGNKWNGLLDAISTYANGAELDRISVSDLQSYADDDVNWRVTSGYGTAISAYGAALPVILDCPVSRIDHSGLAIHLDTPKGMVAAKAVIITVPTNLIAAEAIRFTPALPAKVDAAAGLPLGLADKVYLAVERAEELPLETRLFGRSDRAETGAYHFRPFGRPIVEGYFGGRFARELEESGEGAFAACAIDEIASHLGEAIRARLKPLTVSRWSLDPFATGSYSHALPGRAGSRAILAQPVDGRLFFAGEACSAESFSTAHGAYETGAAAAESALASLTRDRERAG